ncbi:fatty acid and retinol binding protein [Aphelenchoides avenae]|nr:fatty acid and retinol binding protein [Aphelenchus avenae]
MRSTSFTIFLLATCALCVRAYDVNVDKLPEEFADLVPDIALRFYEELSQKDKRTLQKIHDEFDEDQEVLRQVEKADKKLYLKTKKLYGDIERKIHKMTPGAQEFSVSLHKTLTALHAGGSKPDIDMMRETAGLLLLSYAALDAADQRSLQREFPEFRKAVEDGKLQRLAESVAAANTTRGSSSAAAETTTVTTVMSDSFTTQLFDDDGHMVVNTTDGVEVKQDKDGRVTVVNSSSVYRLGAFGATMLALTILLAFL